MYLVDEVIRGVFGAVLALLRVTEGNTRKVQLEGYIALWANPGLDHMPFFLSRWHNWLNCARRHP